MRNFSTIGGNILLGSNVSDLIPILLSLNASLTVLMKNGQTKSVLLRDFYLNNQKAKLDDNEILLNIKISFDSDENSIELIKYFKQSKRKENDYSILNTCFRVLLDKTSFNIKEFDLSLGGIDSSYAVYLKSLNKKYEDRKWGDENVFNQIQQDILDELNSNAIKIESDSVYKKTLALSFFTRFWHQIKKQLNLIDNYSNSDVEELERNLSSGKQEIGDLNENDPHIGNPYPHLASLKQTTGTASYLDDIPKQHNELQIGFVLSRQPHALIKNIDPTRALAIKGVHDFLCHKDLKHNHFGFGNEEIFASEKVNFYGQIIGVIVAETKSLARYAASLVEVEYEPLKPIFTIQEAIENNSFFNYEQKFQKSQFNTSNLDYNSEKFKYFEGKLAIGGQKHFYMETQCCLAIPKREDNEIEVFSSTQNLKDTQNDIARVLELPCNRVLCRVKRMGGAFGGKETRSLPIAIITAAAAQKLNKPVRCVLDRDIDSLTTGGNHPFLGYYKVIVSNDGFIEAYDLDAISNGGFSEDSSLYIMSTCLAQADNIYNFKNFNVRGRVAKTNLCSNTALVLNIFV